MSTGAIVDWSDACARAGALRNAYYALVSGQATASVRYVGNGQEREVRFAAADRTILYREWKDAERACVTTGALRPQVRTIQLIPTKGV